MSPTLSQGRNTRNGSNRPRWYWILIVITVSLLTYGLIVRLYEAMPSSTSEWSTCKVVSSTPVIYQMNTKLGVTYKGSHWFHVAENFMTSHSILRHQNLQSCSPHTYYHFDKSGFVKDLNDVTKLFIILATFQISPPICPFTEYSFHFIHSSISSLSTLLSRSASSRRSSSSVKSLDDDYVPMITLSNINIRESMVDKVTISPTAVHDIIQSKSYYHPTTYSLDSHKSSLSSTASTSQQRYLNIDYHIDSMSSNDIIINNDRRRVDVDSFETHMINIHSTIITDNIINRTLTQQEIQSLPYSITPTSIFNPPTCAVYKSTLGGKWPTPQRGHWFPNTYDIETYRDKIRLLCPKNIELWNQYKKKKSYKIVIYQRDLSRKFDQLEDSISLLKQKFDENTWEIQVLMHKNNRPVCELIHILSDVDILLTPHGFQSMLLLFMPRPSILYEIFPYKYYKRAYGPLSDEYGIIHGGTMSPPLTTIAKYVLSSLQTETCMNSKLCRGYARDSDVRYLTCGSHNRKLISPLDMEGKSDNQRRANRALTQRYDMHALKKIQKLEDDFRDKLSEVYDCDPDDLPFDLDTLAIYNLDEHDRRAALAQLLAGAPKDVSKLIDELLRELSSLQITPDKK